MGQQLLIRPPSQPGPPLDLPKEAPNRPLGEDVFSDAIDALMSAIGVFDPLDPQASKAQTLGGILSVAPILGAVRAAKRTLGGVKAAEAIAGRAPIKAYHGSPHDFDQFSIEKIGTGEGAQAYGHGLYFAEAEDVAKQYRDELTRMQHATKPGRVYEVKIKVDPDKMLDWDASISQQTETVRQVAQKFGASDQMRGSDLYGEIAARKLDTVPLGPDSVMHQQAQAAAARTLREEGVPGLRYLDGSSRVAGQGTRNYVVFDDKLIEIMRKYGFAPPLAMAQLPNQTQPSQLDQSGKAQTVTTLPPSALPKPIVVWSPNDEVQFKRWYADVSQKYDLNPNPEGQYYDYRAAFRAGALPDDTGHWPSQFKQEGHPSMVVGGFHVQTGERVPGTPRASERELIELGWEPETAKALATKPEPQSRAPASAPTSQSFKMQPVTTIPPSGLKKPIQVIK